MSSIPWPCSAGTKLATVVEQVLTKAIVPNMTSKSCSSELRRISAGSSGIGDPAFHVKPNRTKTKRAIVLFYIANQLAIQDASVYKTRLSSRASGTAEADMIVCLFGFPCYHACPFSHNSSASC